MLHQERLLVLGAISVVTHRSEQRFSAEDAEVLEHLARIGGAALVELNRARLEGALLRMHTSDHLGQSDRAGSGGHSEPTRRPSNLPLQPTPLIGREQDVESVRKELMRGATRLITLTGPAGTGKTRLALAVAEGLFDIFEHRIFFVELAPVSDPSLVMLVIAQALGIRNTGDYPLTEHVRQELADKHVLLVLDNFEHLLSAGPQVAELLGRCASVTALVTSRAALDVRGERQYPVPPLALPDATRPLDLRSVSRSPAVALFVQRARASDPSFTLTDTNAQAVAEVCRRLGGLPLAIELAAARSHVLPPQAMARMDRSLALLKGGARDQPERHQTLAAAIAWSYALLSIDQQRLFQQLAVFAGGFTLEAAATVAEAASGRQNEIFDEVGELLAKSLLHKESPADAEPRFRLLETVREYALDSSSRAAQ